MIALLPKIHLFLAALLSVPLNAQARPATTLRASVVSHPIMGATAPMPLVVFDDEPVLIDVALNVVSIPDETPSRTVPAIIRFPQAEWWRSLRWSLRDADGRAVPLPIGTAQVVNEDEGAAARARSADRQGRIVIRTGERPRVVLNVGALPRGDYALQVSLDSIQSPEYRFAVRNGSESPAIRRAWLHDQLTRPQSYERAREIILELASLEPQNAAIFEDLGTMAVANGRSDDADAAFHQAITIIEENRAAYRRSNEKNEKVEKEFDAKLVQMASVRRMAKQYFANRDTLRLDVQMVMGRREYSLVRRDTGQILERVR